MSSSDWNFRGFTQPLSPTCGGGNRNSGAIKYLVQSANGVASSVLQKYTSTSMQQQILVTVVGQDRPGIVKEITEGIVETSANVEESRTASLGGQFVGLFLVSGTRETLNQLLEYLEDCGSENLTVTVKEIAHPAYQGYLPYALEVAGADHQGIIHGVSEFLAGKGVNIAEIKTSVYNSPVSGTPLFSMTALLQVPPNLSAEDLRQSLTDLGDAQSVDITLKLASVSSHEYDDVC